ncbi:MAG: hypothetical protein QN147_03570 [Armatimonadota bacterium]|nr:hypothetical protein [Armatimonadota bacterium]
MDECVFVTPNLADSEEERMTDNVLAVCQAKGVGLTYFSTGVPGTSRLGRRLWRLLVGAFMPFYAPRLRRTERVFESALAPRVVGAGPFF